MGDINVVSRTQRIVVDPFSSAVAVINAGPMGATGPVGPHVPIVSITQAAYDALDPPNPTTFYVIVP